MTDRQRPIREIQPAPTTSTSLQQAGPLPVKVIVVMASVIALVVSGMGYFTIGQLGNDVASAQNLDLGGEGEATADGAVDILLVGTDSRTDAQGEPLPDEQLERLNAGFDHGEQNTDTMMVIRVPADGSEATAVSIPRDTYIHDEEFGNMKINAVFAAHRDQRRAELEASGEALSEQEIEQQATEAGRAGLIAAIRDLTGVDIDHYAEVGLHGFVHLTNAVGGVEVCLRNPVNDPYSGADFPAGRQTLDGYEALAFVRQRHDLPRGDFDRIVRQQAYMASLVNKVLSTGTLTNPGKLSDMADAVERSVVLDEDWDIMSFANQLADLAAGNVTFTTIPVTSVDGTGDYGESIVTVDQSEVNEFFEEMVVTEEERAQAEAEAGAEAEAAPELNPALESVEVHVLNAGGIAGLANNIGDWLEGAGLKVAETTNAQDGIYFESQIVAANPDSEAAQALSEMLGGLPITPNETLDENTLVVVGHSEYSGPAAEPIGSGEYASEDTGEEDADETDEVGTPGADYGQAEDNPELDAGGDGPRCVN